MLHCRSLVILSAAVALTLPLTARAAILFAPYVDMAAFPTPSLSTLYNDSGTSHYTLAFVTAGPSDEASWGGYAAYDVGTGQLDSGINSGIATLRSHSGDVGISFGGASGTDLADTTTSVSTLQTDYQTVLNTYNVHRVDFDIEGADPANHPAVDLRFAAIDNIQIAAPAATPLQVSITLPVEPIGLDSNALYAVQSAITHGVTVSTVNIMAMQFGDFYAPPSGDMGDYVIQSAQTTFTQLKNLFNGAKTDAQIYSLIGVTSMIGQNSPDEIFTIADATKVGMWAAQHQIGELSFWLATRDHAGAGDYNSETDSGIAQSDYQFAGIFQLWANALPGDANLDGKVDLSDLSTVLNHFGQASTSWYDGNFDGAATIDLTDLSDVLNHFGVTSSPASALTTAQSLLATQNVPEPASLGLLTIGAFACLFRRKPR